jgi:hypothetical protein
VHLFDQHAALILERRPRAFGLQLFGPRLRVSQALRA